MVVTTEETLNYLIAPIGEKVSANTQIHNTTSMAGHLIIQLMRGLQISILIAVVSDTIMGGTAVTQ